jgi:hypothetical protein
MNDNDAKKKTPPATSGEQAPMKSRPALGKPVRRMGKPSNPFLAQNPPKRMRPSR